MNTMPVLNHLTVRHFLGKYEAEEVVKKYINDGIEVIVSRGGTASLLEKEVED